MGHNQPTNHIYTSIYIAATCQGHRRDNFRRNRNSEDVSETSPRLVGDLMETSPRLPDTSVAETSPWCEC